MNWLTLLAEEVMRTGSKAKAAKRIGISRSAVSLALSGRYPARTDRIEAKVLEALAGRVTCPHDGTDIPRRACTQRATAPMPMSSPTQLRAWHACQACPNRPRTPAEPEGGRNG